MDVKIFLGHVDGNSQLPCLLVEIPGKPVIAMVITDDQFRYFMNHAVPVVS